MFQKIFFTNCSSDTINLYFIIFVKLFLHYSVYYGVSKVTCPKFFPGVSDTVFERVLLPEHELLWLEIHLWSACPTPFYETFHYIHYLTCRFIWGEKRKGKHVSLITDWKSKPAFCLYKFFFLICLFSAYKSQWK